MRESHHTTDLRKVISLKVPGTALGFRKYLMIQYWMEHVCVGCGGVYHYTLRRLRRPRPRVRMRPRPICGLYQPDMVATKRFLYHLVLGVRAAGLAGLVGIGGVLELDPGWIATGGATVIPVLTLLAQGVLLLWDPNRNLKANR
jgi:hypothetical protein